MIQEQREIIAAMWLSLAQVYGRDIPKDAMKLMIASIEDQDPVAIKKALATWPKVTKQPRHPFPNELIAMVNPLLDPKDLARETALRVRQAVTKFGWSNEEDAKAFIGEAGWIAVQRFGGWVHICENLGTEMQETTFIAQCRDAIESQIKLGDAGLDILKPVIEQSREQKPGLTSSKEILNKLVEGKKNGT